MSGLYDNKKIIDGYYRDNNGQLYRIIEGYFGDALIYRRNTPGPGPGPGPTPIVIPSYTYVEIGIQYPLNNSITQADMPNWNTKYYKYLLCANNIRPDGADFECDGATCMSNTGETVVTSTGETLYIFKIWRQKYQTDLTNINFGRGGWYESTIIGAGFATDENGLIMMFDTIEDIK